MARERILVVDDEEDILELLRFNLAREGYRVACAASGETAFQEARSRQPDLILLDLMLPGMDGLEVCRLLKGDPKTAGIPIIMLTAKSEESDIVAGLELGADDYVTKPFSPKVVIARIRTALRRLRTKETAQPSVCAVGDIVIDPARHEVLVKGKPVELTATEFGILGYLCRHPGLVFTRGQIIEAVKGEGHPVTDRAVDVQVVSLRKKLGRCGERLETVRGVGYRFRE
jgi:two-component system alkaline phosphatase synthesis response regulator PhoP